MRTANWLTALLVSAAMSSVQAVESEFQDTGAGHGVPEFSSHAV